MRERPTGVDRVGYGEDWFGQGEGKAWWDGHGWKRLGRGVWGMRRGMIDRAVGGRSRVRYGGGLI